jgi:hypothetical protein
MADTLQGRPHALRWPVIVGAGLGLMFPAAAPAAYPGANGRLALTVHTWRPPPPLEPIPPDFPHPGLPVEPVPVSARIVSVLPNGQGRRVLYSVPD